MASSPLAGLADLDLLWALNNNATLNKVETGFGDDVDETVCVADDEQDSEPNGGNDDDDQQ